MSKRKLLAWALALALCLGLVPIVAGAAEGNVGTALPAVVDKTATATWTATRLDGTTINQNTYKGKTQILIFFRFLTPCSNSDNTLKGLINNAVVNNENVQIVAIGMGEHDNPPATKEALQSYMAEHGLEEKGNLVFACSNSSNASFQYLTDYTGTSVTSLTYAVNIVLDAAGHIRAAWQGNYDAGFYAGVLEMMGLEGVEGSVQDYQLYTTAIEGKMASLGTDDIAQELTLLNEYRTAKGLGTLKQDGRLRLAAMQRAAELAVYYSHTRPNYTSCFTAIEGHDGSLMAENIAVGYPTAESVMDGWINSAGHRKNIETEAFQSVGLECFTASDGTKYWVQLFSSGRTSSGLGIGAGEEGWWYEDITVARGLLGLDVAPVSLEMRAGGTETVVLNNINQCFPSGISQIDATSVASTDQSVATATIGYDGTVTVTAVAAGSTTIKVGLAAVNSATPAVTVDVPVTVTGTASEGYVFIRSNKWTAVPNLENTYWVEIVDTDGQPTIMCVTGSLKDAIAKDSMILSESRDYVGHFFAVGEIENGVVSRLEPIRDLQDITDMGQGVITLQNNAYGYDSDTKFIYVDMGWADGDDPDNMLLVCEPDRDKLAFLESGQFNPEGFYNANDVNADNNDDGETYSSVRASVIARGDYAEYVYVVRTDWWPAPALGPDQPSQSAQPSASPSASPEPSASSEPSAAPSASPSPSPSAKPSGGSSVSRRPVASVPVETPVPTPSPEPVEPSEVPITPASELFDDVVKGSWYEPGVTYVVIQGLFKGMDVGIFSPNTNMTRAMVMTVLARMDGQDTTNATNGPWHTNIINWAKAKGISDGTMPDSSVTREQLVTLLYRYARPSDAAGDLTAFADGGSVSAWAERAMVWAVNQEIITGKNGSRLDPQGFATRAEVATIFQRFVQKIQPDSGVGG